MENKPKTKQMKSLLVCQDYMPGVTYQAASPSGAPECEQDYKNH